MSISIRTLALAVLLPVTVFAGVIQDTALQIADKDYKYPVIEKTNRNDHPRIKTYCENVSIPSGSPYCAAAVFTWYKEAALKLNIANPAYKTGSTSFLYRSALANPMRFKLIKPRLVGLGSEVILPGDIELFSSDRNFVHGHTALVVRQISKSATLNIEANTSPSSDPNEQREQTSRSKHYGGVYYKERLIKDNPKFQPMGFVRFK